MADKKCPDCQVSPGEEHDEGCDVARCLFNGSQRLMCSNGTGTDMILAMYGHSAQGAHDCGRDIWTGEWPGEMECREFGWYTTFDYGPAMARQTTIIPDLNRLVTEAKWDREQGRWVR